MCHEDTVGCNFEAALSYANMWKLLKGRSLIADFNFHMLTVLDLKWASFAAKYIQLVNHR